MIYPVYEKYMVKADAQFYFNLFVQHKITVFIDEAKEFFDPVIGNSQVDLSFVLRMPEFQFAKADAILKKTIANNGIPDDYYLKHYEDAELFNVLENMQEWSRVDVVTATLLLESRGYDIPETFITQTAGYQFEIAQEKRTISTLALVFAYGIAIVSVIIEHSLALALSFACLIWGIIVCTFTDTDYTGKKQFVFSNAIRRHGFMVALISGIGLIVFWIKSIRL
jgi:hypothetical protein